MGVQCKILNCKVQATQETNYKEIKPLYWNGVTLWRDGYNEISPWACFVCGKFYYSFINITIMKRKRLFLCNR